ncbi:MAG: cytochrome b/b6 domain-containing protein [Verrucomicrobiales bacterium]|nr:cytochrome b/b6 domain-containing protein [Verrucomicrobiales bacterium]
MTATTAASSGLRRIAITLLWLSLLGSAGFLPLHSQDAAGDDAAVEEAADVIASSECLDCHGDADLTMTGPDGQEVSIFVDAGTADASVHGGLLDCVDCHADLTRDHPDDEVRARSVDCGQCHESAAEEYAGSIHGVSQQMGASAAARCADCHGHHDILPVSDSQSPVFKLNLPLTCAKCHSNTNLTEEYQIQNSTAAAHYLDSIHGQALLKLGLIVAPSCNDCHGVHDIKRSVDRDSPINHLNVAKTCGKCHVKVEEVYDRSVHGKLTLEGDKRGPVCTDCHSAHEIEPPVNGHFKAASDRRCGQCHEDRLTHYRDTYHGKAMALGQPNVASEVAACYDCHGHHDVLPPSDPASRLSSENILATCARCHPDATVGFTQYQPHANPLDREHYPELHLTFVLMTGLLIGVFTFFGAHTLLWLARAIYLYLHDSKTFREAKINTQQDDEWFTRFQPFDRFLHFLVVTSFLLLVITGMPLKFYYTEWARTLFSVMGGPVVARTLHHFGALITFLYFGLHLAALVRNTWVNRREMRDPATGRVSFQRIKTAMFGPDSMVPTMQDLRDFVAHNKWFFGKGPKPQFDRWTYWEKFDYFAVFWGVFAIGLSGLVMWFPEFFSRFLPGWVINIALIVHSDEALLAAGFIFTIHFFNTHFRLEKFPMDTVIFSGRVSKSEMLHERRRWYDRLVATGRLDAHRVRDEWERWKNIARSFGYMFFGIGVILLVLIVYAMASRLSH